MLLKFWPELATAFLVAMLVGTLAWQGHKIAVNKLEADQRAAIAAQIASDTHQCTMDKQLTANVENLYESQISDLNRRLVAARVSRPRKCVIPLPSALAAQRFNDAVTASPRPVATGITSESLLEYEGSCKGLVIKLNGLQDFDRQVWHANGQ